MGVGPARVRVLCVDDEPIVLRLMKRLLERMGVDVLAATGPLDALAAFEPERFDLIVTDIRMPGMDGHAFLAEIRALDPEVPVIVATGHASLDNAIRALRDGASGMLMKPFTAEEFQAEVRAALERSRIRRAAVQYQYVTPILDGVALALTAAIEARDPGPELPPPVPPARRPRRRLECTAAGASVDEYLAGADYGLRSPACELQSAARCSTGVREYQVPASRLKQE
jgi:CheY-like chemotaxis protein